MNKDLILPNWQVPARRQQRFSRPRGLAMLRALRLRLAQETADVPCVQMQFAFGRTAALPPGIGVFGGGGAIQVRTVDQGNARYRLQIFLNAQNLTNQRNYIGYSGTMTSPFFGKPTSVTGMRKIDVGIGLNF